MRLFARVFLFLLAVACTGLWVFGYVYLHALACAFVTGSGGCSVDMPWEQSGEDLIYLVLIPGAIVLGLWVLFFLSMRRRGSE